MGLGNNSVNSDHFVCSHCGGMNVLIGKIKVATGFQFVGCEEVWRKNIGLGKQ